MDKEKDDNLFEEDLSMFADGLSELIQDDNTQLNPENNEDPNESNSDQNIDENQQDDKTVVEDGKESGDEDNKGDEDALSTEQNDEPDTSFSLTPYAKLLVDEGILNSLDIKEFDGTPESLINAQQQEINKRIDEYKQSLPEEVHKFIDAYEAGVSISDLVRIDEARIKYNSITEDQISNDENLQKQLIKEYYKQTSRFSDDRINKTIERLADLGELEDEAKTGLKELIGLQDAEEAQAIQEAQAYKQQMAEQAQQQLEAFDNELNNTIEIIPDIKINDSIKDTIKKNVTTAVAVDQFGNPVNKIGKYRLENPIKFEIVLNYLFETTKGFKDFNVFGKSGRKQAYKEFEEAARIQDIQKPSQGKHTNSSSGSSDISNGIRDFMSNF